MDKKTKKWLIFGGIGFLVLVFLVMRKGGIGQAFFGGINVVGGSNGIDAPPMSETTFEALTNPGITMNSTGGTGIFEGDTNYLTYNVEMHGGDFAITDNSARIVDYGSPSYGDYLVNIVAPETAPNSPCCRR